MHLRRNTAVVIRFMRSVLAIHLCVVSGALSCLLVFAFRSQAVSTLMLQKGSTGFKAAPLLKALRAAAVMALPPKVATPTAVTPTPTADAAATESSEESVTGMDVEVLPAKEQEEEVKNKPERGGRDLFCCRVLFTFVVSSNIL